MATMGTMLLRAELPLSASDLRRLVIRSKEGGEGGGRASGDSLRSALPPALRAWTLDTGDGLEIICRLADYKELRKTLKSQRKEMAFSLDKKEDEHLSQALLHRVLEQEMHKALVSRGWVRLKEDYHIRTSLQPCEDGKPILAAKDLSIHFSGEKSLLLLCNPGVVKLFHLDVPSLLPAKLRETLESSGRVCLADWLECLTPEEQQSLRCLRLPSLETGWITGVSKAGSDGLSTAGKDGLQARGEQLLFDFRSNDLEGVNSLTPATCVLRAGGIVPAPFLQRQAHIGNVLPAIVGDLRIDLLGAGHLELQASGEQPTTVTFDGAWTTAGSEMRSQSQLQSAKPLSLNIKEAGDPLWRRARPEPLRKSEDATEESAEAAKCTSAVVAPFPVPRAAPLLVPKFGPRAPKGSSIKRKPELPGKARGLDSSKQTSASKVSGKPASLPAPKKATVPAASKPPVPRAKKAAAPPTTKPTAPAAKKAKTSSDAAANKPEAPAKGGIPKPPAKKPESAATGTATSAGTSGSAPPAKKPVPKASSEDVDALVREKFSSGKLKDVTLPRLKQFITTHKLGKVGGKKEALMATIEAFLGKKEP